MMMIVIARFVHATASVAEHEKSLWACRGLGAIDIGAAALRRGVPKRPNIISSGLVRNCFRHGMNFLTRWRYRRSLATAKRPFHTLLGSPQGLHGREPRPAKKTPTLPASCLLCIYKQLEAERHGFPQPTQSIGGGVHVMSTKRNAVADLQRELLEAAVKDQNNRLRFIKSSAETLATTYAALLSLQRKKLIEPEKASDPAVMSWRITKAGKAAIAEKSGRR
jgi:hypothetical protein